MKSFWVLASLLAFMSCDKPDLNYDVFFTGQQHYFCGIKKSYDPDSAEALTMIKNIIYYRSPHYYNVYVVKIPPDTKSTYTVVPLEGEEVIFWFHFYNPKTPDSLGQISLNYDNTADSIDWYLSPFMPYFKYKP